MSLNSTPFGPDGDKVKMVGLTIGNGSKTQKYAINKPRLTATQLAAEQDIRAEVIEIVGELKYADSVTEKNTIKIVDDAGVRHPITVPLGIMADIVKPLWANRVRVKVSKLGRKSSLIDIEGL